MASTLDITVTDEDIANGIPGDTCNCPIALAVKRSVDCIELCVGHGRLYFRRKPISGRNYVGESYLLPTEANRFIKWFDVSFVGKYLVKPTTFKIEKRDPWF